MYFIENNVHIDFDSNNNNNNQSYVPIAIEITFAIHVNLCDSIPHNKQCRRAPRDTTITNTTSTIKCNGNTWHHLCILCFFSSILYHSIRYLKLNIIRSLNIHQ